MKQGFGVAFEPGLLAELDKIRGLVPRSTYLESMVLERVKESAGQ